MRSMLFGTLLFLCVPGLAADFVGAEVCGTCHKNELTQWQKSDHFHAMQIADAENVLGDFNNTEVVFHNIKTRFFRQENKHFIETLSQTDKTETFEVLYSFGHRPLQQYLVDIGSGKLQAFNIAWDSRAKDAGGQRWFHLQPEEDMSSDHPFFWQGHFQNWNSRCAECHSTNLKKNYNAALNNFNTQWSDINVACEACHGPGSDHLTLAQTNSITTTTTGLLNTGKHVTWQFNEGDPIAKPQSVADQQEINICGGCHSRRLPISESNNESDYHDQYLLQLLSPNLYFSDGQIQDEVFVLGSFLQSKMYQQGVRCTDCHNPHSGELKLPANNLCSQCHSSVTYDDQKHHGHLTDTKGSFCVDCHMPSRTYMGVDNRRDHSFVIPRQSEAHHDNQSACTNCHTDKSPEWIDTNIEQLRDTSTSKMQVSPTPGSHWSTANHNSRSFDMQSVRGLTTHISDEDLAPIIRATLIEQIATFPSRRSLEVATRSLQHNDPLIRRSGVSALGFLPPTDRWSVLKKLVSDESRSVRFQVAATMVDGLGMLASADNQKLEKLIREYEDSLAHSADSPATQMSLANLAMQRGQTRETEQHYRKALTISPGFVPALLNFAEFLRATGRDNEAEEKLQQALQFAPDSAGAQHAYGLHLVRLKRVQDALPYLKTAATIDDAQPRFSYVYAVALDSIGATAQALVQLKVSDRRWPNQIDTLNTLLLYADKLGQLDRHMQYVSKLSALSPSSPLVKRLLQKYQSR